MAKEKASGGRGFAHTTFPARDTTLTLAGLGAPVQIITDRYGIPHIRAQNLDDLYYAWGFVTARDRLWQLEYTRRGGRGELSEWLGNRTLRDDAGAQLFELRTRAERIWSRERERAEVRVPLERFAAGVNAYIGLCASGARPWPEEFMRLGRRPDPWRPEDSVMLLLAQGLVLDLALPELDEAVGIRKHGMAWLLARRRFEAQWVVSTIPDSIARRLYGAPAVSPARAQRSIPQEFALSSRMASEVRDQLGSWLSIDGDGDARASNVFAVGGNRSTSGKPLLANDPHLDLKTPNPLHVVHLSVLGRVNAIGAAVPGLPAIVTGRNEQCAWGITSLGADVIDVYADSLSPDGHRVKWNGAWVPLREEDYRLRYRALGIASFPLFGPKRRYGPHGPVLVYEPRRRLALGARWAGDDTAVTMARLLGLERSESATEVAERYRSLVTPTLNVVAADVRGQVIYQTCGAVPRRGFDPSLGTLPGDGHHEWQGLIPSDRMPSWQVPADGFVVNANNLPVGAAYPEPLPRFDWPHDRAARISQRLHRLPRAAATDLQSIQNDTYSRGGERFVPRLLRCADSLSGRLSGDERAILDSLRAWHFFASRSLIAPTLFRMWYGALLRRSDLSGLPGLTAAALDGQAAGVLMRPGGREQERPATAAVLALRLGVAELGRRLGADRTKWQWGRAHRARMAHPLRFKDPALEPDPVGADGDNGSPCAGPSNLPWSTTFAHAPVFRHVVDLAVPDSSLGVIPPGDSGDPTSTHARDQTARWADHQYVPFYLDWERVVQARESEIHLLPSSGR